MKTDSIIKLVLYYAWLLGIYFIYYDSPKQGEYIMLAIGIFILNEVLKISDKIDDKT